MTVTTTSTTADRLHVVLVEGLVSRVKAALADNVEGFRDAITAVTGNARTVRQNADGTWPTITRRAWLDYLWLAHDLTAPLPDAAVGAAPGDLVLGVSDLVLPEVTSA